MINIIDLQFRRWITNFVRYFFLSREAKPISISTSIYTFFNKGKYLFLLNSKSIGIQIEDPYY